MSDLSLAETFRKIRYSPHRGQRFIHANESRHRVVSAGRRFGKSELGGHELTPEAVVTKTQKDFLEDNSKRREFWIVGPNYSDSEKEFRVFYDDCRKLGLPFDRPGTYNDPHGGDMQVSLWDGRFFLIAKSAQHPDRLVGEGLSGVILAEAAKLRQSVWTKFIRPALADELGWSLLTSTPEGKNWFYEQWQRGQDEENEEISSWRLPSWMNKHVFRNPTNENGVKLLIKRAEENEPINEKVALECGVDPEIAAMLTDMSVERFRQEVMATFEDFVGRVFKEWDEEFHVTRLNVRKGLPIYTAVDYGWTNPFVALAIQVDKWDRVRVLREYRRHETTIYDIAEDLAADPIFSQTHTLYPDPAEPGDTRVLKDHLRCHTSKNVGGPIKDRLEMIRKSMRGVPSSAERSKQDRGLMIDRSCTGLIYEMGEYSYPDSPRSGHNKEEPKKEDDHGPEALGRFFKGFYGGPKTTKASGSRTSSARMRRRR